MISPDPFIISPATFALIQNLQAIPALKHFSLAGGTGLPLQIGHRNSIDIDLFTRLPFETPFLIEDIRRFLPVSLTHQSANTALTIIENVKTDFIRHNYPLIKDSFEERGIRFLSVEDIAAMKLNAVVNSGKRLKDFVDIFFLLEIFSMKELIQFYAVKYPDNNSIMALKAVEYFEDIDPMIDPPKIKRHITLEEIKDRIKEAVINTSRKF